MGGGLSHLVEFVRIYNKLKRLTYNSPSNLTFFFQCIIIENGQILALKRNGSPAAAEVEKQVAALGR